MFLLVGPLKLAACPMHRAVMKELVAILFYLRIQWHYIFLSLSNVREARGEHIKERIVCVQALGCTDLCLLGQGTWFELVIFNWGKTLGGKITPVSDYSICDPVKHSLVQ